MSGTLLGPEIWLLGSVLVLLLLAMTARPSAKRAHSTALLLSGVGVVVCLAGLGQRGTFFFETYRLELFSQLFKVLLSLGLFLVVVLCAELRSVEERHHPEFYLLLFTCTLAMTLLVSGVHFLTVYLSLELSSYSLYVLVSLRRGRGVGVDAAIRYFLVGVSASAVMLFGFALLYSVTGTAYLRGLLQALPAAGWSPMAVAGLALTAGGFLFKLAAFPFHFWAPDAYQGAPNQVTAYIATASKVAAIAILVRWIAATGAGGGTHLAHALFALSVISMTLGNLAAIAQQDVKRLFAYSSISHAGYALIGILAMSEAGYAGAVFYAVSLLVMKFTAFLVLVKVAYDGANLEVAGFAGLHRRSPILAAALLVALFSLAGIPPTVGFTGKFLVFAAAMGKGYFVLVLIAMINVVVSLYYYLLVLRSAYLLEPPEGAPALTVSMPTKMLAAALIVFIVVAGVFPRLLLELANRAAASLL